MVAEQSSMITGEAQLVADRPEEPFRDGVALVKALKVSVNAQRIVSGFLVIFRFKARARSLMFIYLAADGTQRILELEQALQLDLSNPICRHSSARGQGLMRSKKSNAAGGKLR